MVSVASRDRVDVVLVGAGIMGATVAALLNELQPGLSLQVLERLDGIALESAAAMNNAGTGHAANCELNYTPERADGSVEIGKALGINHAFEISLQFWSHLVEKGRIPAAGDFCRPVPHISFVWGEDNVRFLRARHAALHAHPMFADMAWTEDPAEMGEWMPLVMAGRERGDGRHQPLAAHRVRRGTDLNFGRLAQLLFAQLESRSDFALHRNREVVGFEKEPSGRWRVISRDRHTGATAEVSAGFVFIGAGGGALPLLLKSGIPEARGYCGMPVSGQWLVCTSPEVVARHDAKVYGKASLGAPPMSVPHLDTRIIDGKKALLFGPYAGFTTKYLKQGSWLDWPLAMRPHNAWPLVNAGWRNRDLARYLIGQVLQSHEDRMDALREYFPEARSDEWRLAMAGQRVQIVKRDPSGGGKLEFGTEVVSAADGTFAALLGASPGASTAVATMADMLLKCFRARAEAEDWRGRIKAMIPSFGEDLTRNPERLRSVRDRCNAILGLAPAGLAPPELS